MFLGVLLVLMLGLVAPAHAQLLTADALRPHAAEWERLLAAEDARASTPAQLATLVDGTRHPAPAIRAMAFRALGRLERADLVATIAAGLGDADADVRAASAHALGQAVVRVQPGPGLATGAAIGEARHALLEALTGVGRVGGAGGGNGAGGRGGAAGPGGGIGTPGGAGTAGGLDRHTNAVTTAAVAETLGRLGHGDDAEFRATLHLLLPLLDEDAQLGALRGLFFLARQPGARGALEPAMLAPVREIAASGATAVRSFAATSGSDPTGQRTRTVAIAILAAAGATDEATLAAALRDPEPLVRREAALAAALQADSGAVRRLLTPALADSAAIVRYDALRGYARRLAGHLGCAPILAATRDGESDAHVALLAIDALGAQCASRPEALARLDSIAGTLPAAGNADWHRAARALVALAPQDRAAAERRLPGFATHPNFFVRNYAAQAATAAGDAATLRRLAGDAHPNVRTAAVVGLGAVAGRAADDVFLAQLASEDSQLLQRAAAALEGSPAPDAPRLLADALDRVSAARRETSRDARRALLQRLRELGTPQFGRLAPRIEPYLRDFDPVIAGLAADVLHDWTGTRPEPRPTAPDATRPPTFAEMAAAEAATVVFDMADGATFTVRLHPFDAPTNVARFLRLARAGHFDGLTFHRVVPAFVVQGGSPHANEYAGDGPFTRDELGRENWRGTVGLSTRGRDTGDGQIFLNLIDNVRLDHDYTIFATVTSGMAAVGRMQEGAQIRHVR